MGQFSNFLSPESQDQMAAVHPRIPDLFAHLRQGTLSRRQFVRLSTLLGLSAGAALAITSGSEPEAQAQGSTGVRRGGTWTCAMQLQLLDHPARLSWAEGANVIRQVGEYLTETGPDNITRPLLLERWEASEDVRTWTLYLQQGITFNNGDELTAADVMFSFGEWLNPDIGSSMLGLLSYLRGMEDIEQVDEYTIRLNLQAPNIGVPEHLFHYPAIILHRDFEGDFVQQPVGTGPFTLEEYAEGERAILRRREGYWQLGADGDPLPYLDELIYVSLDKDAAVAALQSGQVDSMYQPRPSDWQALKDNPDLSVLSASTSSCFVLRMRTDVEPWSDVRVRNALKLCQDRERILQLSYFGEGDLSSDAHVAPIHPSYAEMEIPDYDPEEARRLLEEAGYPEGLQVVLATKNNEAEPEIAQALREMAAPAGFDIQLDITEPTGYWDRWTEVELGLTAWIHRPLAPMTLALAYTQDAEGNPVAWNETRWVDEEFSELLIQAESTLDVEERRQIMAQLQQIMQERGPIGNSYWRKVWTITHRRFQNVVPHPAYFFFMNEVWIEA